MITKWKLFTEEIEEDKWSVQRYGNGHAVYYDGVIVGFDDREIGAEENVQFKNYNATLVYSTERTEVITIFVVDYIDKIFQLEKDKSPAIKEIAQKLSEKIYPEGFFIKLN